MTLDDNKSVYALTYQYIEDLQTPNPRQRSRAAQELGKLKADIAVPELVRVLKEDVNTYVRSASAEALGVIGSGEAIFPLMDAMHDPCSFVRRAAITSLGELQAKEAQGAMLQALDDQNFYVQRAAINAIGKLGIPDLSAVLLPILDTNDARILRTVINALRRLDAVSAVPHLIAKLESYLLLPRQQDLPVVKSLVITLGEMRSEAAVPVLVKVVRGYVGVRSLAATALGQIGAIAAGPVLVEALSDRSTTLQIAAMKSIGRIEYREAAPEVRRYLSAEDPQLRRVATLTSGYLRDHEAIPALLQIANRDSSPLVRPAAVEALGMLGDRSVVRELLPLTEDSNAYLRAALSYALSALDGSSPDVREALKQLSHDKVEHVASAARIALSRLREPRGDDERRDPPWFKRFLGLD